MDDLPIYFDATAGVYRFLDDADEDSGVEELPFSSYITLQESEVATQNLEELQRPSKHSDPSYDPDDDDLTYVDDDQDDDYRPNKSVYVPKKGKTKLHKKRQYNSNLNQQCASSYNQKYSSIFDEQYNALGDYKEDYSTLESCDLSMFSPNRSTMDQSDLDSSGSSTRHYARKDRTPRTILKMMEKHRESERVRHHTLNESMKDVCMRVPGYDPDVKETKVIQMQRIIGYECFLENTLTSLCEQMGVQPKMLRLGTHFITDAMKDTPIEDFYRPSHYKTSDIDEDENDCGDGLCKTSDCRLTTSCQDMNTSKIEKNMINYKREKISSPTVDSTTDNIIKIFPSSKMSNISACRTVQSSNEGSWPTQSFIPIESSQGLFSSQESGIKVETQSSIDEDAHFTDLAALMDQGLLHEQDHISTASFMKDEMVPTSTNTDDCGGFSLSSPVRYNQKVFLHSPRSSDIWQSGLQYMGKSDTPSRVEMQIVSPENVLETKPKRTTVTTASPKVSCSFGSCIRPLTAILSPSLRKMNTTYPMTLANINFTRIGHLDYKLGSCNSPITSMSNCTSSNSPIKSNIVHCKIQPITTSTKRTLEQLYSNNENIHQDLQSCRSFTSETGTMIGSPEGKNKRKRYTPLRSPFLNETNCSENGKNETKTAISKILNICENEDENHNNEEIVYPYITRKSGKKRPNVSTPATATCARIQSSELHTASRIDHRKSTWMNGFMIFSQLNRSKFTRANPGVHSSHIQKMLGHAWRSMAPEDQKQYKDTALHCSNYMGSGGQNKTKISERSDQDSVVHSSTSGEQEPTQDLYLVM